MCEAFYDTVGDVSIYNSEKKTIYPQQKTLFIYLFITILERRSIQVLVSNGNSFKYSFYFLSVFNRIFYGEYVMRVECY